MIAVHGGSIKSQQCGNLVCIFNVELSYMENWENFEYIQLMLAKSSPKWFHCLTILTLVIDNLENLGQGQNVQKKLRFEARIFLNKRPTTNLADCL